MNLFTHLVDLTHIIKEKEKIPIEYQKDFDQWFENTLSLHNKLRGFKILDTLPYSTMIDIKTGKRIKDSFTCTSCNNDSTFQKGFNDKLCRLCYNKLIKEDLTQWVN